MVLSVCAGNTQERMRSTLFLGDPAFVQRIRIESTVQPKREVKEYMYSFFHFRVSVRGNSVRGCAWEEARKDVCHLASTFTWSQECSYFRVVVPTLTDARHGSVVFIHHRHRHE